MMIEYKATEVCPVCGARIVAYGRIARWVCKKLDKEMLHHFDDHRKLRTLTINKPVKDGE